MSKDKRKSVKELNAELELLAERVKKLEEKDASEVPDKVHEKLNGIEEIVKSYDKKIGDLERELLQARHNNNVEKDNDSKGIDGEVCDKTLIVGPSLKEQIKTRHSKTYECEFCDDTFTESWKMEEHLEHHGNERPFKCSICEKGFYMKWRMEKHTSDHRVDIKFCHYFNSDKPCPYDKVGCRFKHETAPECRFNLKCTFKLCQFTHTTKKGEEAVHRGHLLPAIISTDRTIAHREFMKPLEDAEEKSAEEYISDFREALSVTTMDNNQPVALEQFTKFREHSRGTICKEYYRPNLKETLESAACELATSLKAAQKKLLKERITAAAKSLNPAKPTQEQHFRTFQLLSLTALIEEDDDALYMVNDPVPLSDPYLRDVLKLICHADYKLGTGDQPPHFIGQDGAGVSFSEMVDKLKL